jgi:ribose/xylose/arabinose/galactoside ABC-type transport system permease subunit
LAVGGAIGLLNGLLAVKARIPSFIATLGVMSIARAIAFMYTNGYPIYGLPGRFQVLGRGYIGPIPITVAILLATYVVCYVMLKYHRFGRYLYAIGGNREATRLSGINVDKYRLLVFVIGGLTAGLSGIILTSRFASGQPNMAYGIEFDVITMVVLGGTSLSGGIGTIQGTLLGAVIIGILGNGLNLLGISSYFQTLVKGLFLLFAVFIDLRRD